MFWRRRGVRVSLRSKGFVGGLRRVMDGGVGIGLVSEKTAM